MHNRHLALAVLAAGALYPAVSGAWPGKTSFDACVNAFEKSLDAVDAGRGYKTVYHGDRWSGSIAQYFAVRYTFDMQANDPKTGAVLARARCSVDGRGTVSSLSKLPTTPAAPAAALAAAY